MPVTVEALGLLLVLLPGFLSSVLLDHICVRRPKDNFSKAVEALVFSFFIYAMALGIAGPPQVALAAESQIPFLANSLLRQKFVWTLLCLSLVVPLIVGFMLTRDVHMRVLRRLGVTAKTARDTTWLDVFGEQRRYVIVNLNDQRRVFGWPMYYSNTREEELLYLQDPAWVSPDGTYIDLGVHGLLLLRASDIFSIEFTKVDRSNAQPRSEVNDDRTKES